MLLREPVTIYHERPSQRLARLAERIAASRGAPIETFGTADLVHAKADGGFRALMQADQILYLDPGAAPAGARVDVDGDALPDVVLEVDYSTDVRVWKLPLYEAWGFPEVWVDVPDERSHPRSRLSGLTIHVHDGERFQEAPLQSCLSRLDRRGDPRRAEPKPAVAGDPGGASPRGARTVRL